jgi:phage FluMu protein Com
MGKRNANSIICISCNKLIIESLIGEDYEGRFECPRCHTINTLSTINKIKEDESKVKGEINGKLDC